MPNKNENRPYISVNVHGVKMPFLYDSGAQITVISEKEFRKISLEKRPSKIAKGQTIQGVSGNMQESNGIYAMRLNINGRSLIHPVQVIPTKQFDCILGVDAIRRFGINYIAKTNSFSFDAPPDFEICKVNVAKDEFIKPFESRNIQIEVPRVMKNVKLAIAAITCPSHVLLMGGPGLVDLQGKETFWMNVKNCSPTETRLVKGEEVGFVECVQNVPIQKFEPKHIENEINAISIRRPANISEQRKNQILNDLNLTVPEIEKQAYIDLILRNHDVFSKDNNDLGRCNFFTHKIHIKEKEPIYVKQFKIPDAHRQFLEAQVKDWLKLGIIERSNSRWNSPVFCVPKKGDQGNLRVVQDFRQINNHSEGDRYSMKEITECIGDIGRAGSTIFSTMDLTSGFWQMPLDKDSQKYTAFTIPGMGQFQWLVSAMGLKSCPGQFQRMAEMVCLGLAFVIVYIDDLLVHGSTHEQHRKDLQQLFDRLRKANLKLKLKKCYFGAQEVSYLGFRLTPKGILPGFDKLKVSPVAPPAPLSSRPSGSR